MTAIVSNHIVHATDRIGSGGYVTRCRVVIPKPVMVAKVSFATGFPTSPQGWPCKQCFGKESAK